MKKIVIVGLVVLPLLLAVMPRSAIKRLDLPLKTEPAISRFQTEATVSGVPVSAPPQVEKFQSACANLLAGIAAETDPDRHSETIQRVVDAISDAELPAMLDSLAAQTGSAADELRQLLIRRWAENNPVAAAAWLAQQPANSANPGLLEQVAIAWANTNLIAAINWQRALPDGEGKQAAAFALAYEAARTQPVAALELARTLPATSERDSLLVHAASQWAVDDAAAAAAWAEKVSEPVLRQQLLATVAVALGKQDGAAAATFAANALDPGELQDRTAVAIAQRWAQTQPSETATWISQFPTGYAKSAAEENVAGIAAVQSAATGN